MSPLVCHKSNNSGIYCLKFSQETFTDLIRLMYDNLN